MSCFFFSFFFNNRNLRAANENGLSSTYVQVSVGGTNLNLVVPQRFDDYDTYEDVEEGEPQEDWKGKQRKEGEGVEGTMFSLHMICRRCSTNDSRFR